MVKKMKVVKKAKQKNVVLDRDYYLFYDIKEMLDNKEICYLDNYLNEKYDVYEYVKNFDNNDLIIFLDDGDEIKINLDEYGYYKPVLIKNGKKYFIKL